MKWVMRMLKWAVVSDKLDTLMDIQFYLLAINCWMNIVDTEDFLPVFARFDILTL